MFKAQVPDAEAPQAEQTTPVGPSQELGNPPQESDNDLVVIMSHLKKLLTTNRRSTVPCRQIQIHARDHPVWSRNELQGKHQSLGEKETSG